MFQNFDSYHLIFANKYLMFSLTTFKVMFLWSPVGEYVRPTHLYTDEFGQMEMCKMGKQGEGRDYHLVVICNFRISTYVIKTDSSASSPKSCQMYF
jgi:hypothetical protein